MRLLFLLPLLWLLPIEGFAQSDSVPDTLDWRGYYPLEIGNVWEWRTEILIAYTGFDRREVVGDTLISDTTFFTVRYYAEEQDPISGVDNMRAGTFYLRYDTLRKEIVMPDAYSHEFSCGLAVDFGSYIECPDYGTVLVDGGYDEHPGYLIVGVDTIWYAAVKHIGAFGGATYYHGIGSLLWIGDGESGSRHFTYLRLGGKEYGEQAVISSTEAVPSTPVTDLQLFPNPARHRITLRLPEATPAQILLYDLLGRETGASAACTGTTCLLENLRLAPGTYFVEARQGTRRFTRPVLIVE